MEQLPIWKDQFTLILVTLPFEMNQIVYIYTFIKKIRKRKIIDSDKIIEIKTQD